MDILLQTLKAQFALDWEGIHGIRHWERVRENGQRLAALTGANPRVVEFFALLHDSRRESDGHDPEHGARAAEFAPTLTLGLPPQDLDLLVHACRDQARGSRRET